MDEQGQLSEHVNHMTLTTVLTPLFKSTPDVCVCVDLCLLLPLHLPILLLKPGLAASTSA